MTNLSKGSRALAISDRSGMQFPYREMVREWNGAFVHVSEYEPKQPQLDPINTPGDPQGLQNARPDRTEPPTFDILPDTYGKKALNKEIRFSLMVRHEERKND